MYSLILFWCSLSQVSLAGKSGVRGEERCWGLTDVECSWIWCEGHTQPSPKGRRLIQSTSGLQLSSLGLYICSSAQVLMIKPVSPVLWQCKSVNVPCLSGFEFPPCLCPSGPSADVVPCYSAPIFQCLCSCGFFYSKIKTGLHLAMFGICPVAYPELISQISSK